MSARLVSLLLLAGCALEEPTYSNAVRPMIEARCLACHLPGGVAPFALTTVDEVRATALASLAAMEGGRMPPWSADPDCREVAGERLLSPGELEDFRAWVDADMPEGEPTQPLTWSAEPFEPTRVLMPAEAYTPMFEGGDTYRCLPLGEPFETDTYVLGSQVTPGSAPVHHVLVYALQGEQVEAMWEQDHAAPGAGYPCFGGPVPQGATSQGGLAQQIGAWVPGAPPSSYPEGTALRIGAGSQLLMQVHYSAVAGDAEPDRTRFAIRTTDVAPQSLVAARPLPVLDLFVPAGASEVTATRTFGNWRTTPLTVRAAAGHMHLLGSSMEVSVRRGDASETCLLDVPDYDFEWQQQYVFAETVEVLPGETLEVSCTYDNSEANQPVVDGVLREPENVEWGDGTLDEMCLVYLGLVEPFAPTPEVEGPPCASVETCMVDCEGSLDCLLSCPAIDERCNACVLEVFAAESLAACPVEMVAMGSCVRDCGTDTTVLGGVLGTCLHSTCPDAYADFLACADAGEFREAVGVCRR